MSPTAADVLAAIEELMGVEPKAMLAQSRRAGYAHARRIAAIVMRDELRMSFPEIATALGLSSHASVHRAVNMDRTEGDRLMVELVAQVARKSAGERDVRKSVWAKPAVPARMLVYAERYLESVKPPRASGVCRMTRKKVDRRVFG